MRRRVFTAPLILLALALIIGCGGRRETKVQPRFSPDQIRDQREALDALQAQADSLSLAVVEIQALAVQVNAIQTDADELRRAIALHRDQLEKFMAATPTPSRPDWLTNALIFLFGVAVASILYFGLRLMQGYDEGELPPEAYTPGMTTAAGPEPTQTASIPEPSRDLSPGESPPSTEKPPEGTPPETTA
jgi:hypothetical protein